MMAPCATHGLVAGPDGRCVLCRRSGPPPRVVMDVDPVMPSRAPWIVLGAIAGLAVGATVAIRIIRSDARPVAAQSTTIAAPTEAPPPRIEPPGPAGPSWSRRDPRRAAEEAQAAIAAAETARDEQIGTVADDARVLAESRVRLDAEMLATARRRVSITVYTTSWCPSCNRAKEWMRASSIPYVERDVEDSPAFRDTLRRLNPRGSIPTFAIDDEVLVGFSPSALQAAIDTAARRRLR